MIKFNVGELAVSLKQNAEDRKQHLTKGEKYMVLDTFACKCGRQMLNVTTQQSYYDYVACKCGTMHDNHRKMWTSSEFFARPSVFLDEAVLARVTSMTKAHAILN